MFLSALVALVVFVLILLKVFEPGLREGCVSFHSQLSFCRARTIRGVGSECRPNNPNLCCILAIPLLGSSL